MPPGVLEVPLCPPSPIAPYHHHSSCCNSPPVHIQPLGKRQLLESTHKCLNLAIVLGLLILPKAEAEKDASPEWEQMTNQVIGFVG